MKERLTTLGLAFAALMLVYILFLPKPVSSATAPPRPLSTEVRADGYRVIWQWLHAERISEVALRGRYDRLATGHGEPGGGNVLISSLPHNTPVTPQELRSLHQWIRDGNTLLVSAALDDTPLWATVESAVLIDQLWRLTGLAVVAKAVGNTSKADQLRDTLAKITAGRTSILQSRGAHALMRNVRAVKVVSALPSSRWVLQPADGVGVLSLANLRGTDDGAVWLHPEGAGQVIVLAYAGVFGNGNITAADNGVLLSNILAWSLKAGGSVIFDDAHQGAVDYYDAKAFFADPRLHRSLAWLVLLWFVFVLGIQRLRIHQHEWRPIDITAFIGISGEFLASATTPVDAAARLMGNFFNSIRRRLHLREDGTPHWSWLESQPNVDRAEVRSLRAWHVRVQAGKPVDLLRLQGLIRKLQEKIL